MSEIAQLPSEHPWTTLGIIAVVLLVGWLRRPREKRPPDTRPRGSLPRAGEVWYADVPFEEGTGSKDRPVLVLAVTGGSCEIARFTTTDRSSRRDYVRAPQGVPGLPKASWLELRTRPLPQTAFRTFVGNPGMAFVAWYRDTAPDLG